MSVDTRQRQETNRRTFRTRLLTSTLLGVAMCATGASAEASTGAASLQAAPNGVLRAEATASPAVRELTVCLQRSWIHSHEEDSPEVSVYRPADYAFPPSRGRTGYEFLADGTLAYRAIAPADGPLLVPGTWEQISPAEIRIEIDEPDRPIRQETLEIVSCSEELLEIAREAQQ